jgi:phosphoribosylformylglycinamidine cyclo-ligase
VPELGATVADALLAPHRSYLSAVRPLLAEGLVKGIAHVTGGGLTENIPRVLPEGCGVVIDRSRWRVPPIFTLLQRRGGIDDAEMLRAFNMGIGLVLIVAPERAGRAAELLGADAVVPLGRVEPGERAVRYTAS